MVKSNKIYLDYAASVSANPSSIHSFGLEAKRKLQSAREEVAKVLSARPEEIIFTSGGTESNNLAIQGVILNWYENNKEKKMPHIITTNIEHASVLETFKLLEKRKLAKISIVEVEKNGIIDPQKIKKEIKENTVLVSVMYANNEIGTIQPIREIGKEIKHFRKTQQIKNLRGPRFSGAPRPGQTISNSLFTGLPVFHTDAVQAVNYLNLNVQKLNVDLLSLSGSKIEGAGSVGVLYRKNSVPITNVFGGGGQEFGLRPGTENLKEILKFSSALNLTQKMKEKEVKRLTKLRDHFLAKLEEVEFVINGDLKNRLPNNINITISNIPSDLLIIELSARGIMASSKSACKSGDGKASHVIQAINKNIKEEDGSIRFSLGRGTTKADIDYTLKSLSEILTKLKKWYN